MVSIRVSRSGFACRPLSCGLGLKLHGRGANQVGIRVSRSGFACRRGLDLYDTGTVTAWERVWIRVSRSGFACRPLSCGLSLKLHGSGKLELRFACRGQDSRVAPLSCCSSCKLYGKGSGTVWEGFRDSRVAERIRVSQIGFARRSLW